MFDSIVFSEKLRNHRKLLNLTQEEVAVKIGVTGQSVSKWEMGECLPDCYNLKLLGEIYGISLDVLLETGGAGDNLTVIDKISQLATEYAWNKISKDERDGAHKELGDDLWEMWKAIYYVEIGDKKLQEREVRHANNRLAGAYGTKIWDDNGVACVIKSKLKYKLEASGELELKMIKTLITDEYCAVLKLLDCHYLVSKSELIQKTGLVESTINEIIVYLTENRIVELLYVNRFKTRGL